MSNLHFRVLCKPFYVENRGFDDFRKHDAAENERFSERACLCDNVPNADVYCAIKFTNAKTREGHMKIYITINFKRCMLFTKLNPFISKCLKQNKYLKKIMEMLFEWLKI